MTNPYKRLEKEMGYSFKNRSLLSAALVHRSFRFENRGVDCDNQRLEFLGDAALGVAAAAHLYDAFPDSDEGTLTRMRSCVTSGKALAGIARRIALGDEIKIGHGEEMSGGRRRPSNLADALEAVLGAAYLDGGMKAVDKIFRRLFASELDPTGLDAWADNPKGRLQEAAQRVWRHSPEYRPVDETGPSHAKVFVVEVLLNGIPMGRGEGSSKRDAEAQAAAAALRRLADESGPGLI